MTNYSFTDYTYEKYIDYEVNANNLWKTGWYRISANVTSNFPISPNGFSHSISLAGDNVCYQTYYHFNGDIWTRSYWYTGWHSWKKTN